MMKAFKSISKDLTKTMKEQEVAYDKNSNIIPFDKLNKLKKYDFQVNVKKLKKQKDDIQYYQILLFFKIFDKNTFKNEYRLVYATNKNAKITLITKEVDDFFWKKHQVQKLSFGNSNEELKMYKWIGKFRNAFDISDGIRKEIYNENNF